MQYTVAALALSPSFVACTEGSRLPKRGKRTQPVLPLRELVAAPVGDFAEAFSAPSFEPVFTITTPRGPSTVPTGVPTLKPGTIVHIPTGVAGRVSHAASTDYAAHPNDWQPHTTQKPVEWATFLEMIDAKQGLFNRQGWDFVCDISAVVVLTCPKCDGKGQVKHGRCHRCRGKGWMDATDRKHAIAKGYASPRV